MGFGDLVESTAKILPVSLLQEAWLQTRTTFPRLRVIAAVHRSGVCRICRLWCQLTTRLAVTVTSTFSNAGWLSLPYLAMPIAKCQPRQPRQPGVGLN